MQFHSQKAKATLHRRIKCAIELVPILFPLDSSWDENWNEWILFTFFHLVVAPFIHHACLC